jgi:glucokinase
MVTVVAGVDIGGTHVTVVLMDGDGNVLQKEVSHLTDRDVNAVITVIAHGLNVVLADVDHLHGIGVGVPGNVDPVALVAKYLPNFAAWPANVELGKLIREKLTRHQSAPMHMRNDGRCAALAESRYGAGRESAVFSMLTLGTGIGGALVIHKKLFDGSTFDAGDFGHAVIRSDKDAFDCNCGKRGCFETQASAYGLVKQYHKCAGAAGTAAAAATAATAATVDTVDTPTVSGAPAVGNAEQVLTLVRAGDATANRAFGIFMDDLSTGIANLVTFYNPDVIAIGGGLAQAPEIFERIGPLVDQKTLPATKGKCRIVPAALGTDAGAIGACVLALFAGS